jgi:hypothetical protein
MMRPVFDPAPEAKMAICFMRQNYVSRCKNRH